jgi:phage terminase large subunit GpA-like protein
MVHAAPTNDDFISAVLDRDAQADAERSMSIGDWGDQHIMVPRGSGITPYVQSLTPYWRHWHSIARARITGIVPDHDPTAHQVEAISLIAGTQIGKTQGLMSPLLAWVAVLYPRDLGVILPSHDTAKHFGKNKLDKVFRKSPRLHHLVPKGASEMQRLMGTKAWFLPELAIHFKNGAVALHLRSDDLPLVFLDEFDALPENVDGEGSPIALIDDRQKTFPFDRLRLGITTPTFVSSLGWSSLCKGSNERLLVACRFCGAHQYLDPDRIEPLRSGMSHSAIAAEDAAIWKCSKCARPHCTDDVHLIMARACESLGFSEAGGWVPGEWTQDAQGVGSWTAAATFSEATGRAETVARPTGLHRSGWLNSMYSRFITVGQFLAKDIETRNAKDEDRQAFINGWRCEPFVARCASVTAETITVITADTPAYQHGMCPVDAWRVVLSCDQQGETPEKSWFPYRVRAYAATGESWLVEAGKVVGFDQLELLAAKTWPIGQQVRAADLITIDTANGSMIRSIRQWCAREPMRRVSIAGSGTMSPETPWSEIRQTPRNAPTLCGLPVVFYYNAHHFRDDLFEVMRGAPGRQKFNVPANAPRFYLDSLQAEERIQEQAVIKGRHCIRSIWRPRQWTDERGVLHMRRDNHWLDCEVMGHAAVTLLGWFAQHIEQPAITAADYVSAIPRKL